MHLAHTAGIYCGLCRPLMVCFFERCLLRNKVKSPLTRLELVSTTWNGKRRSSNDSSKINAAVPRDAQHGLVAKLRHPCRKRLRFCFEGRPVGKSTRWSTSFASFGGGVRHASRWANESPRHSPNDTTRSEMNDGRTTERIWASIGIFIGVAAFVAYPCALPVLMLVGSNPEPDHPILRVYRWSILIVPLVCVGLYNWYEAARGRARERD
jgi:hypothetical protein